MNNEFTMLKFNTFEVDKMGNVEFAFKIYDQEKADEIRTRFAKSI